MIILSETIGDDGGSMLHVVAFCSFYLSVHDIHKRGDWLKCSRFLFNGVFERRKFFRTRAKLPLELSDMAWLLINASSILEVHVIIPMVFMSSFHFKRKPIDMKADSRFLVGDRSDRQFR